MNITWKDFENAALTREGLLSDLLAQPEDPNTVLAKYGLDPLTQEDVERWMDTLSGISTFETEELLGYIGRLTDHHEVMIWRL